MVSIWDNLQIAFGIPRVQGFGFLFYYGCVFTAVDNQLWNLNIFHGSADRKTDFIGLEIFIKLKIMRKLLFRSTVFDIGHATFLPLLKLRSVFLKPWFKIRYTCPGHCFFNSWIFFCFYQDDSPAATMPNQSNGRNFLRKVFISILNTVQNPVQIL